MKLIGTGCVSLKLTVYTSHIKKMYFFFKYLLISVISKENNFRFAYKYIHNTIETCIFLKTYYNILALDKKQAFYDNYLEGK